MAKNKKQNLYIFGWPSFLGGADTKLADLLELLHTEYQITVIPNWEHNLKDKHWTDYLEERKIKYCLEKDLDDKLTGVALSMCNSHFFKNKIHRRNIARGLKNIWSSEMMWKHEGEDEAISYGEIHKILLVSDVQKKRINYEAMTNIPTVITGNWINPDNFTNLEKTDRTSFTIGRVSRADPAKYPENFPAFYEWLIDSLPNAKARVLGWSDKLSEKWSWFKPNPNMEFLNAASEPVNYFYNTLDVFVYPLGHTFTESWGRSVVEAQLCGLPVLVDPGHHMDHTVLHGKTGFFCKSYNEYKSYVIALYQNEAMLRDMSARSVLHATELMNREKHLKLWKEALDV